MAKKGLSPKTELAMRDLMKTSKVREYFGQYAIKVISSVDILLQNN